MTLNQIADELQTDCHIVTEKVLSKSGSNTIYQDAVNVWLFRKLAELILANKKLESRIHTLECDLRYYNVLNK